MRLLLAFPSSAGPRVLLMCSTAFRTPGEAAEQGVQETYAVRSLPVAPSSWRTFSSPFSSDAQPFWHQGPISWKTVFAWTRHGAGVRDGFHMVSKCILFIVHFISNLMLPVI